MITRPCGYYDVTYRQDQRIIRTRAQWGWLITLLIVVYGVIPLLGDSFVFAVFNNLYIYIIATLGLALITGYCGQISLGQVAFMAIGAYTSTLLGIHFNLPFWIALPCAAVVSALSGLVIGIPSFRLKGFYLLLSTIAFHVIVMFVIIHTPALYRGGAGLTASPPRLGGLVFDSDFKYYFICITALVIMTCLAKNITRGRLGRAFIAVRDNDIAAELTGIDVKRVKLQAFALSALFGGVAGSLWAHYSLDVHPAQFTMIRAVMLLGMLVVGGTGSILGAVLGVLFLGGIEQLLIYLMPVIQVMLPMGWAANMPLIIYGIIIMVFMVLEPRGLAHLWTSFRNWYRLWPFKY